MKLIRKIKIKIEIKTSDHEKGFGAVLTPGCFGFILWNRTFEFEFETEKQEPDDE